MQIKLILYYPLINYNKCLNNLLQFPTKERGCPRIGTLFPFFYHHSTKVAITINISQIKITGNPITNLAFCVLW